jgi:hypothetical protein
LYQIVPAQASAPVFLRPAIQLTREATLRLMTPLAAICG